MYSQAEYTRGQTIHSHFNPGIVAASYFASLCGCLLTIELLHRRGTALGNWRSWLETLGCATSMGLVGIWCMHFIGNRAIVLGDGAWDLQLVYNPGFTTLSVFLPIIGLTIAFSAAEYRTKSKITHWLSLVCTGIFAGLSIVGMHYIGNFGISNYKLNYKARFLAASTIIAIGDCMVVLILFYTLRERWISSWWKRLACAFLLAGGVSAMHFTASTQCIYTLQHYNNPGAIRSRNVQVAVAGALCGAAACSVVAVLFFTRHRSRVLKSRSQKVMLACAMFDPQGRILVTTEGVLPAREITDRYQHRSFSEDFDTAHPVFQWIYRVTRNWSVVADLIPQMKSHLSAHRVDSENDAKPISSASSAVFDPNTYSDYSVIFRERFCCAAASLASAMHFPVENVGVLYDKIVETGTLRADEKMGKRNGPDSHETLDVESGKSLKLFGRGQLMFLTRELSNEDTDTLLNAGYRFASVQQVGRNIAASMQIPQSTLELHVQHLQHFVSQLQVLDKPGTWLSFFSLIPRPNTKGFDVGVKREDQDQLPDVQILAGEPEPWQAEVLQRMDGLRARSALSLLEDRFVVDAQRGPREQRFAQDLHHAILTLGQQVPPDWFKEARFLSRPVFAHYSQHDRNRGTVTWVYAFCVIADMHTSVETCAGLARIPLTFFSARQRCYKGSPDHGLLAQHIHQEFGPLLARKTGGKTHASRAKRLSMHRRKTGRKISVTHTPVQSSRSNSLGPSDRDSEHELVDYTGKIEEDDGVYVTAGPERGELWGGILVNSETVVKSDSKSDYSSNESHQLGLGMKVAVGTAKQENTFVDDLMEVTRARFQPPKIGY